MYHYVYRLDHIETGEFYIGSRSSKYHPTMDKYMGSMKTWKPDKSKLIKTIIKDDFTNRHEAILFESKLISENVNFELNRNYYIPTVGFQTIGMVTVRDINGKCFNVSINDEKYLSGELKHVITGLKKGLVLVKDLNGNNLFIDKNNSKYISGEFIPINKDFLPAKDENGNFLMINKNDEKYLSGEIVHVWKNKVHSETTKQKIGIANSKKQKGNLNSQYNTCWIFKDGKNLKIKKEELSYYILDGWSKGRIIKGGNSSAA